MGPGIIVLALCSTRTENSVKKVEDYMALVFGNSKFSLKLMANSNYKDVFRVPLWSVRDVYSRPFDHARNEFDN